MHKDSHPRARLTPDQIAAHLFATQLQTRIATVPLPYPDGDETAALQSLVKLFESYRKIVSDNPGCAQFTELTLPVLNGPLRNFTARWHRKQLSGELDTRDGAVAFRTELRRLQKELAELNKGLVGERREDSSATTPVRVKPAERTSTAQRDGDEATIVFGIAESDDMDGDDRTAINEAETEELHKRRGSSTGVPVQDAAALAFSGGGIRSASFCLGAAQVLAERQLLRKFDLLSTVSGGGYTGAFLTRTLSRAEGDQKVVAGPHGPDTEAIQHLRRRAAYLRQGNVLETIKSAGSLLLGLLLNWTAPLAVLSVVALLTLGLNFLLPGTSKFVTSWMPPVASGAAFLALLCYAISLRYNERFWRGSLWAAGIAAGALAIYLVPLLYDWFLTLTGNVSDELVPGLAVLLAATLPTLSRILPSIGAGWIRRTATIVALGVAAVTVPVLSLYIGFVFYYLGGLEDVSLWPDLKTEGVFLLIAIALVQSVIALCFLNINRTGPFEFYRRQLAKSFLTQDGVDQDTPLGEIDPDRHAPYLLINAVANLPSSNNIKLRERKGDFFLFSSRFTGSPLLRYRPSADWYLGSKPVDLSTAVAVSGAAVAPHMALLTIGPVRALMSVLNLRLGLWLKPPGSHHKGEIPGARNLLREIFGWGMSETADWIDVSDGGHLENSAVYELLRRRCRFIVAVDGSADPRGEFDTLMTLVRHARIDHGIEIRCNLDDLRANAETGLSPAHGILCEVIYPEYREKRPDAPKCLMLVVKLSMTGNETELINAYRRRNPAFPNQPTSDQFFDEHQFEAYRNLGAHAMESMFQTVLLGADNWQPENISDWLNALQSTIPPGNQRQ